MSQGEIISIGQQAIYITILASAPLMGVGLIVGLIISIFQAVTQINEQTLVFIPKMISVLVVLILAGPWIMNLIIDSTLKLFAQINTLVS